MLRSAVSIALSFVGAAPCAAQLLTSIGASAATVRHRGVSSGEALSFAPRLDWRGPGATLVVAGAFAIHDVGEYSFQGGPRFYAVSSPMVGPTRLGIDVGLDGTVRSGAPWTAATDAVAEAVWLQAGRGVSVGAGMATGGLQGRGPVSAGRLRARAWGSWDHLEALVSIEPVWLPAATYTELAVRGGVLWSRVEALAALLYREGAGPSSGGAQFALRLYVNPVSAVELGLGTYLADPIQGLPPGRYGSLGIRVFDRQVRNPVLAPVGRGSVTRGGEGVLLEFDLPAAHRAEIAGDWNNWVAEPMKQVGGGRWRIVVPLERGVYHFNVRLDGARWVVPEGITALDDGFGGKQGVLIVM